MQSRPEETRIAEGRMSAIMRGKCREERGETLIEVMASILIMTLSILLLFSAVMASVRINKNAREQDEKFYKALNAAEEQSTPADFSIVPASTVTVEQPLAGGSAVVGVTFYGEKGALSYKYTPSTGP